MCIQRILHISAKKRNNYRSTETLLKTQITEHTVKMKVQDSSSDGVQHSAVWRRYLLLPGGWAVEFMIGLEWHAVVGHCSCNV